MRESSPRHEAREGVAASVPAPPPAPSAPPVEATARRRVAPTTWGVVAALVAIGAAWFVWARLTAPPGGGRAWGAMDSILAAAVARQAGQPAPPFVLADPSGRTVALEDLRGQVVLVNFWASWCGPCRAEMPLLDQAAQKYQAQGFQVLAVNVEEDASTVRRFGEELKLGLPLLLDPSGEVHRAYNVQALPTSFLIGRDGMIRDVHYGVLSRRYLDERLPALLAAPEPS
jgi:peroxiredoxin